MNIAKSLVHTTARSLGVKLSTRVGIPRRVVVVKETFSQKAKRVFADCERISCRG